MRISEKTHNLNLTRWTRMASNRLEDKSRIASTGYRVGDPSDDPVAYGAKIRYDARLAGLDARGQVLNRSMSNLMLAESTLASAGDVFTRAKELAVAMSNGTLNANDRNSAAIEIAGLRDNLMALANARSPDGYLFSGTATNTAAVVKDPVTGKMTYQGNNGRTDIEVADGVTTAGNANGIGAFSSAAGGVDPFEVLEQLRVALVSNNATAVRSSLSQIDDARSQIVGVRSDAGMAIERLRNASSVVESGKLSVKTALAGAVEGDAVGVLSDLVQATNAYERSVQVGKQLLATLSNGTKL
jgi:flagellar hook-associated protein 3 FlgL